MKTGFPFPASLLALSSDYSLAKGERLFSLGAPIDRVFYVMEGEIRAIRCLADGAEAVMMRARGGEFFAVAGLFLPQYPCDAEAAVKSRLRVFPADAFQAELGRDAAFATALIRTLAMDIKTQCGRVERLRLKRVRDRVVHYLACESQGGALDLGMPILEWADELGAEPETVYRVLAELEAEGRIARKGRSIRLTDAGIAGKSCGTVKKS